MANITLPLLLSLGLVLSIQSIVGDEEEPAPEQTEQNTSEYADATGESLSTSLENTDGSIKDAASPLSNWKDYGILSPQESMPLENSAAPRYPRAFGPGTPDLIDRGGLFPIDPPIANPGPLGPRTSALTDEGGSPEMAIDGGLVAQNPATNMPIDEGGYIHIISQQIQSVMKVMG
ncbi:hypothetical protein PVK06_008694 [Gossypium arboreum]|uniref:Uncharacterized protein n=1 Tax=Gossypium arboreum TaxID=29729 RepID=A0ABR0QKL3_GOSAR|nr:hypothetical protein PVK06_008694 [Gossypium arboreum]